MLRGLFCSLKNSAVQFKKHEESIIKSLKDKDISLRRRALDVLYSMCDSENSEVVVGQLGSWAVGQLLERQRSACNAASHIPEAVFTTHTHSLTQVVVTHTHSHTQVVVGQLLDYLQTSPEPAMREVYICICICICKAMREVYICICMCKAMHEVYICICMCKAMREVYICICM
jgi:hypothetical protein